MRGSCVTTFKQYTCPVFNGLEACPLLKFDLKSPDFVIIRFLMKLFNKLTTWILSTIVNTIFDVELPSNL